MKYKLKSGLTKTKVYEIVNENLPEGIELPPVRKCGFKKNGNSYWLTWLGDFVSYRVYFSTVMGWVQVRTERTVYDDWGLKVSTDTVGASYLTLDYCLNKGLLREVA